MNWKVEGAIALILSGTTGYWLWSTHQLQIVSKVDYDRTEEVSAKPIIANGMPKFLRGRNSKNCNVIRVSDGDTIRVNCGGSIENIRFCGVDAPEIQHGNKPGQPLGNEAKKFVEALIDKGKGKVMISEIERDRYGRIVGEIFVLGDKEEHFVNGELVLAGLAYEYKKYSGNCPNREAIESAESIAKPQKVGVWDGGNYQKPWDFRKANK